MDLSSILSAEKSKADINSSMILMLFYLIYLYKGSGTFQQSSSFRAAKQFLEPPTYELHDVYRALSVLASEMDFIQSEVYKNSFFLGDRMDRILYYDCTNYYFEIEQEDGDKKYGKSKEHRPNPIIQRDSLQMVTEYLWLSHSFLETKMSRNP